MKVSALLRVLMIGTIAITAPVSAQDREAPREITVPNPQIDYSGFARLTSQLAEYRSNRLVGMKRFNDIARTPDALILDTRSAAAFRQGHIEGAINIPFSDFTDEKLAKYLGDKSRPILIYCNNNFRDDVVPVVLKSAPLALNIPTFINLYGYGYENIYELSDVVPMSDPAVNWVSDSLKS